jgi:hypothetical protein
VDADVDGARKPGETLGADALSPRVDSRIRAEGGQAVPQAVWQQSLSRLKGRLSETELGCWVQAIHPVAIRDRRLYGEVPSEMHLEQIRNRLQRQIAAVLQELLGSGASCVSVIGDRTRAHRTYGHPARPSKRRRLETRSLTQRRKDAEAQKSKEGEAVTPFFAFLRLASMMARAKPRGSKPLRASSEPFATDSKPVMK